MKTFWNINQVLDFIIFILCILRTVWWRSCCTADILGLFFVQLQRSHKMVGWRIATG